MTHARLILLTASISLLISIPALASPVGESAGEIWVDGPADVQPGLQPGNPDAAVDGMGRSIFVWGDTPSTKRKEVFLRIFPADGSSPGDQVQVNTFIEKAQQYPRVAVCSDNSFLVIWQSDEPFPENMTVDRKIVRSQAFDAAGDPLGDEQVEELVDGHLLDDEFRGPGQGLQFQVGLLFRDLQQSNTALEESEQRYRRRVEDLPTLVCGYKPDANCDAQNG